MIPPCPYCGKPMRWTTLLGFDQTPPHDHDGNRLRCDNDHAWGHVCDVPGCTWKSPYAPKEPPHGNHA